MDVKTTSTLSESKQNVDEERCNYSWTAFAEDHSAPLFDTVCKQHNNESVFVTEHSPQQSVSNTQSDQQHMNTIREQQSTKADLVKENIKLASNTAMEKEFTPPELNIEATHLEAEIQSRNPTYHMTFHPGFLPAYVALTFSEKKTENSSGYPYHHCPINLADKFDPPNIFNHKEHRARLLSELAKYNDDISLLALDEDDINKLPPIFDANPTYEETLIEKQTTAPYDNLVEEQIDGKMLTDVELDKFLNPSSYHFYKNCTVCFIRPVEYVMLPCYHYLYCFSCINNLTHCALCGTPRFGKEKIIMTK